MASEYIARGKKNEPAWPEVGEANTQPTSAGEAAGGSPRGGGNWQIPTMKEDMFAIDHGDFF